MTATEWAMANKVKTGLGLVAAIAAVVVLPVSFVTWAEEQTAEQVKEQALIQQGREEAAHSVLAQTHQYDFAAVREELAEAELIDLEQSVAEGAELTPTEQRKMRRLEKEIEQFAQQKEEALENLQEHEDHGEKESE